MRLRTIVIAGAAAAYLFGTEQGRQLVDKIKSKAKDTWEDPSVQEKVKDYTEKAGDFAKEKAGDLRDAVGDAAHKAGEFVKDTAESVSGKIHDAADRA